MADEEKQDLPALATYFPPAARGLRARVVREYRMIEAARKHGWSWPDIAAAMGMAGKGKASAVSTCFSRVRMQVKAGDIDEVPDGPKSSKTQFSKPAAAPATTTKGGGIPPPPLPGGKVADRSINDGMDEIRKQFDN